MQKKQVHSEVPDQWRDQVTTSVDVGGQMEQLLHYGFARGETDGRERTNREDFGEFFRLGGRVW